MPDRGACWTQIVVTPAAQMAANSARQIAATIATLADQQPSPTARTIPIRASPERRERIARLAFNDSDMGLCFLVGSASGCR
jgi:hypothetical protein